jgi:hypothetical protein
VKRQTANGKRQKAKGKRQKAKGKRQKAKGNNFERRKVIINLNVRELFHVSSAAADRFTVHEAIHDSRLPTHDLVTFTRLCTTA